MHPTLLATDQIRCYAENGDKMPCAGTGQDAAFKKREPGPWRHRFQSLGDLVRDT